MTHHVRTPRIANELPLASTDAPIIYFDGCPIFGIGSGVAHLTLETVRHLLVDGNGTHDRVVVAHLRTSINGLRSLKAAVDAALSSITEDETEARRPN